LVRKDLSPSQIAVQAIHAAIEVARSTLSPDDEHPHVVLCGVNSEQQLFNAMNRLQGLGIEIKPFYEADLGDQLTAIAAGPIYGEDRRHFRRYQLLQSSVMKEIAA
jgi:hypothetical protein